MERDSFIFYRSFYEAIRDLPRDIRLEVLTAIMEYALYGRQPDALKPFARSIFTLIKPNIDANLSRYTNGKKGGRPRQNPEPPGQKTAGPAFVNVPGARSGESGTKAPDTDPHQKYLQEFFAENHRQNLDLLLKDLHLQPGQLAELRTLAQAVIAEWQLSDTRHRDYNDWSRHLISSMRIKNRENQKTNGTNTQDKHAARRGTPALPHTPDDYEGAF